MKTTLASVLLMIMLNQLLMGQGNALKIDEKFFKEELLIDKNINKLGKKNEALQKLYNDYKNAPDSLNRANLLDKMMLESYIRDIRYRVHILTQQPGAMVRYKSKIDPAIYLSTRPTNDCVIELPIGTCIFWTERDGKRTSNQVTYVILGDLTIFIEEKP